MGKEKENRNGKTKGNAIALLPIGVFLVLYLGLGILFEYVMKIPMGFYNVPIVVAFLAAILVACLQNRAINFDQKLEIMSGGVGDKNIITMLLIFLAAGSFVGVVGRGSAESVAYCMLSLIPARYAVAVLFVVACFVSVAMGTSVGTITLLGRSHRLFPLRPDLNLHSVWHPLWVEQCSAIIFPLFPIRRSPPATGRAVR